MRQFLATAIFLFIFSSSVVYGLDLSVASQGAISSSPIQLTINGSDFDPTIKDGRGLFNYDLPEQSALIARGLSGDKGISLRVINFDNRPWTLSVGSGVFTGNNGELAVLPESQILFMVTYAGTYDANNNVFLGSTSNDSIRRSIKTLTFVPVATITEAYVSSEVDTNHGTLGQAFGFSNGTEILVQLAVNLSSIQQAGTYSGLITFKATQ